MPKVHEMDLLPKHMCHRCTYKLEEFYKFYVDCLKTDAGLKSQLSWMGKDVPTERVGIPMVHIENVKIKIEPGNYDAYDMNPMVDNVNYINAMSSMTFQPNDIPYAAYARCRCCCDKMDQSNQAVPTNYENRISTCNSVVEVEVEACNNNRTNKQQSSTISVNENKPTSSSSDRPGGARVKFHATKDVFGSPIVRNLRPRKGSVDYVGSKKKSPGISTSRSAKPKASPKKASPLQPEIDATRVKVEKLDDFEGRILRPRTGTIDYCMSTRKHSKSTDKNQRSQDEEYRAAKYTVRNIANKVKLPSREVSKLAKDRIKVMVKEEQLSDLDETVDEFLSSAMLPKDRKAVKIEAFPNGHLVGFQNDRVNGNTFDALKSPKGVSKGKLKSGKMGASSPTAAITYSPKFLRSHDSYLRSGKIKKLHAKASARKLQRNLRNVATITGVVSAKNISASINLIDSNVKHYCEDCNASFLNKELFKLHTCYH
ncbi:uncharacterized protein LOC143374969 isoform X2 [Andrena cerasifolii]|uniref:uncharacterized protein LOC143374969 isoform X2 n=1 Tax=Andrena cerasifolii TaxID=2819439 RepID=UPI004037BFF1